MRLFILTIPLLLLANCQAATPTPADAICDGTRQARTDLAAALVADGGDRSLVTGQALIAKLDAACAG